jgi:hypothetical protein
VGVESDHAPVEDLHAVMVLAILQVDRRVKVAAVVVSRNGEELDDGTAVLVNSDLNFAGVDVDVAFGDKAGKDEVRTLDDAVALDRDRQFRVGVDKCPEGRSGRNWGAAAGLRVEEDVASLGAVLEFEHSQRCALGMNLVRIVLLELKLESIIVAELRELRGCRVSLS